MTIWSVFEKVVQSNTRFNDLGRLVVVVHWVAIHVRFRSVAVKTKGRQLAVLAHLKRSIIEVIAKEKCLPHALIIEIARFEKDPNYASYRRDAGFFPVVNHLLRTTGIDVSNGGGIRDPTRFQGHYTKKRIIVYGGLILRTCVSMVEMNQKRESICCMTRTSHYHVITKLTSVMAKRYVCEGCGKGC